jgi:hypothetical protein
MFQFAPHVLRSHGASAGFCDATDGSLLAPSFESVAPHDEGQNMTIESAGIRNFRIREFLRQAFVTKESISYLSLERGIAWLLGSSSDKSF